ncbi:unannotated protein [freshwater metagenome]|uniref:Unannotated protein n=1 Tax=freshwater metagenome TaxID=449393 RepID=A0A6J6HG93_9ZZZZ|nr:hypothetical protein [Actinomycetota bacterium]MSW14695.1 hypothetical protein [Actinomycetota bacterium]MSW98422.1 hypothetical protein [Actinomycetota bacterium]MSY82118.1 hypothetical protein [Actinomycetota bacterium]MSZ45784.1 hypothetical protein [Actinomycetota bacterium]
MTKTLILLAALVLILAWYLSFLASRLDRLHHRVETSWEHLDALLQRRAAVALEIAHFSDIDPATSLVLTASAYQAREASILERSESESSLSEVLKLFLGAGEEEILNPELSRELREITEKIRFGITTHLEAVNTARNVRNKFAVKLFRLAGHAPLPVRYAFEDDIL